MDAWSPLFMIFRIAAVDIAWLFRRTILAVRAFLRIMSEFCLEFSGRMTGGRVYRLRAARMLPADDVTLENA
jgi:hypothetical protein